MFRKNLLVFFLSALFVLSLSACAKKQTAEPMSDPEVMTEPEPMTEVDESMMNENDVEEEPMEVIPVLEDVFFEFDKADLSSEAKRKLENNARQLKEAMSVNITVEGHCDERGTNAYNLALGERRAKAAANFLRSLGVQANRVKTVSYGEERPFATGSTEAAWAKNRRAHFVIAKK